MPRIFDNIELKLDQALKESLDVSYRADFCVGFFNLRGWHLLQNYIDKFEGGDGKNCRLLIGMNKTPLEQLKSFYSISSIIGNEDEMDREQAKKIHKSIVQSFKDQLVIGIPDDRQEKALRKLLKQLKTEKVEVKLYLKNLHAKLYLAYRNDKINPTIPYMGSSNLTLAGLSQQGELNVDVLDQDAATKLSNWFQDKWTDTWCIDITKDLIEVIENSWCREEQVPPYWIYLKMAYHIAQEAREGLAEFRVPKIFKDKLLDFQTKAVLVAAKYLNNRNGVLIGDVVGLGKTITAAALAKVFEDDLDTSCLIICPANLIPMWDKYIDDFDLRAKVISSSVVQRELPEQKRYRLVIIDESHNLRNKESKRYNAIRDYIQRNESKVILLSATPYNKSFQDLSTQLRFFITDDEELPVRPERLLREASETKFINDMQVSPKSILAFEKSDYAEDWQELLRYYMVRRTRSFIKENYALNDESNGRKYLEFSDGSRSYFPDRYAKSIKFKVNSKNPKDQYAKLYSEEIVMAINNLEIPRYGLAQKLLDKKVLKELEISEEEQKIIANLSRAGKEIMGFCRTNLFKRLESNGYAFLLSIKRHILRNNIFLYAVENQLPLPIGSQSYDFISSESEISDTDDELKLDIDIQNGDDETADDITFAQGLYNEAASAYKVYSTKYKTRFKWIDSKYFKPILQKHLIKDNEILTEILEKISKWNSENDEKLNELTKLITQVHSNNKVLIFTQYADTANYLYEELKKRGIENIGCATGQSENPTFLAYRFSPYSNKKEISKNDELRVLISTDVLSEGQNLQDSFIVVNFDLPWAIIKLIQRAGRVDRIGQKSSEILCYNFLPAEGVEKIISLRHKLKTRLKQNAEVVGTDEQFFEDEDNVKLKDLYNEKASVLDDPDDNDIDLSSYAYQIWKNALDKHPELKLDKIIPELSDVIYSTKKSDKNGALIYTQTGYGNDILSYVDKDKNVISHSQFTVLKMAESTFDEKPIDRLKEHHELVRIGVENILREEKLIGGQLGKKSSARYRLYQRLSTFALDQKGKLFDTPELHKTIDEIYKYQLTDKAKEAFNRQLKSGIDDYALSAMAIQYRQDGILCVTTEEINEKPPRIICSLGLNGG